MVYIYHYHKLYNLPIMAYLNQIVQPLYTRFSINTGKIQAFLNYEFRNFSEGRKTAYWIYLSLTIFVSNPTKSVVDLTESDITIECVSDFRHAKSSNTKLGVPKSRLLLYLCNSIDRVS